MKRGITDTGSLLNVISPSVLVVVDVPREKITRQAIEVFGFRGKCEYTLGFVSLDPTVGPMRTANKFHGIDSPTTYHLLFEKPLITIIRPFLLHIINV